jgi:uncharacterized protein YjbJ (UPF0337 family)
MSDDKLRGTGDELKGRLKEAAGDLTDDERLRQEGQLDQAKGQVERSVGDLKEKAADALADVMDD